MAAVTLGLAACSGGSHSSSSAVTATTVQRGTDQATSLFCITMTQLTNMTSPGAHPVEAGMILDDAVKQAPASIGHQMQVLATFLKGTLTGTTSTPPSDLEDSFKAVAGYISAHCGITLPGVIG